ESILPSNYEDNLPVSPSITLFNLSISTVCDFLVLSLILRCMPNLRRFIIAAKSSLSISPFSAVFMANSLMCLPFSVDIHCADDMFDQEERANKIIRFIDLTRIKKLEFRPMNVISQLHLIKQILL
ncbi:unnamed protein product, partial [Rotaria sp. Silwood2]